MFYFLIPCLSDCGLIVPAISQEMREQLCVLAAEHGISQSRQLESYCRSASDMAIHLIGGSHRFVDIFCKKGLNFNYEMMISFPNFNFYEKYWCKKKYKIFFSVLKKRKGFLFARFHFNCLMEKFIIFPPNRVLNLLIVVMVLNR